MIFSFHRNVRSTLAGSPHPERPKVPRAIALLLVAGALAMPRLAAANVIVGWDWNDGTTQGWLAGSGGTVANDSGRLQVSITGNGSLQVFGPDISALDLTPLTEISFDLSVSSFDTVSAPGDLAIATLFLGPLVAGTDGFTWDLDLSGLAFDEFRTFNLAIADAQGTGTLADFGFVSLTLAAQGFPQSNAVALLDNLVLTGASVPEPATLVLVSLGLAGLRRRRRQPE